MPKRENDPRIAKAKAICSRCPVRILCLQEGLEPIDEEELGNQLPVGIWGGRTLSERMTLKAFLGGKTLAEARAEQDLVVNGPE